MSIAKQCVIRTKSEKCTGCRRCQLICSFHQTGAFNPLQAHILIDDYDESVTVTFTEHCDQCGACVPYCVYGALQFQRSV